MEYRFFLCLGTLLTTLFLNQTVCSQTDFFWSDKELNQGANNAPFELNTTVGNKHILYLYMTTNGPADADVISDFLFEVQASHPEVIRFTSVAHFNAELVYLSDDEVFGYRTYFQEGIGWVPSNYFTEEEFTLLMIGAWDYGIQEQFNGAGPILDLGYDPQIDAFICGRIGLEIVGEGQAEFEFTFECALSSGDCIDATYGELLISSSGTGYELGDVNHDFSIDLLDVPAFISVLISGEYVNEADLNQDGVVNLLDKSPFIDAILGD